MRTVANALFDFTTGQCAADCARNLRGRAAIAATDLTTQKDADQSSADCSEVAGIAFDLDDID